MVRITINGMTAEVDDQLSILKAAESLSIHIPTLCYHKDLSPHGACRMCVVEVEGSKNLLTACTIGVMNNMSIQTHSPSVMQARKTNLELMLARHPVDCLVCEKGGECDLQRLSFEIGISRQDSTRNRIVDIFGTTPLNIDIDDTRSVIERDLNKCVLCKRCIRICDEIQGVGAVAFARRGSSMSLGTFYGSALDCEFCGQCVDVCPVGALFNRLNKYKARPWELRKVDTICPYCGVGCSVSLGFKGKEVVRVTSSEKGVNNGFLCAKGRYGYHFISDESRLGRPLIRRDGGLEPSDWDTALELVVRGFEKAREKYGSDSVYGIGSARCTNEENYLFQKLMRVGVGTNNIDTCARFEHAAAVDVMKDRLGHPGATNTTDEVEGADVIFLVGCNVTETHPILGIKIKAAVRKNKAKLVVMEPRKTKILKFAHLDIRLKPGSDFAFIVGMIRVILKEKLQSKDFIRKWVSNFTEFKKTVSTASLKDIVKATGISEDEIRKAARIYAGAENAMILFGMGMTQHRNVHDCVNGLINMALLTGQIGKKHSGVIPVRGQNNVQGACDMGVAPDYLPGYGDLECKDKREVFEKEWKHEIPEKKGLTLSELTDAILDGKVKALYIMGENLLLSSPNIARVKKALSSLDLLVVQDLVKSETAEIAHVVLPASSFAEKDGTYTNMDRKVQRLRRGVEPLNESKPDWEILKLLMKKMGVGKDYWHPSEIMEEISRLVPIYKGVDYMGLKHFPAQWPCHKKGEESKGFISIEEFSRKKFELKALSFLSTDDLVSEAYPFLLLTGKGLFHYHTGTMTRRSEDLMEIFQTEMLEINPEDAASMDLVDGDRARVTSSVGNIEIGVKLSECSPRGTVFSTIHFRESAVNNLMDDSCAGSAKIPDLKMCSVNIEKIG